MRVIPLLIEDAKLQAMERLVTGPVIEILPLKSAKVGVVTTGSEVYSGRIQNEIGRAHV